MHKKTAPLFVHYGEPEKIKKSFAFNVDIFTLAYKQELLLHSPVHFAIMSYYIRLKHFADMFHGTEEAVYM